MPTIRVDEDVYSWLKSKAVPFEDTPNSVLRKIAGFGSDHLRLKEETITDNSKDIKKDTKKKAFSSYRTGRGTVLAKRWNVDVIHSLYHKEGTWFNHLKQFPGALFDPNGYVIFNTEKEYKECPYLNHGIELNVHRGISSIPGYKQMI